MPKLNYGARVVVVCADFKGRTGTVTPFAYFTALGDMDTYVMFDCPCGGGIRGSWFREGELEPLHGHGH